jgi:hypothetical protein
MTHTGRAGGDITPAPSVGGEFTALSASCEKPELFPGRRAFGNRRGRSSQERSRRYGGGFVRVHRQKIEGLTGKPTPVCLQDGGATTVPVAAPCRSNIHLGGMHVLKAASAAQGVEITIVYAAHAKSLPLSLLGEEERKSLAANGLSVEPGPPTALSSNLPMGSRPTCRGIPVSTPR